MKVIDRVKTIETVDNALWDDDTHKLTVYHHGDRNTVGVKVADLLRQDDVIDSIDEIILIS